MLYRDGRDGGGFFFLFSVSHACLAVYQCSVVQLYVIVITQIHTHNHTNVLSINTGKKKRKKKEKNFPEHFLSVSICRSGKAYIKLGKQKNSNFYSNVSMISLVSVVLVEILNITYFSFQWKQGKIFARVFLFEYFVFGVRVERLLT